jgi:pimeloyl-ACP methyl ester carboxylesterase
MPPTVATALVALWHDASVRLLWVGVGERWRPRSTLPMPMAPINGIELYYETAGSGPPLVLVHGFGCGLRSWEPQVRGLAGQHRVITYDVRGHGISGAPEGPEAYSQAISVEDLRQLLVHLGLERAAVGGLSMGGNIALTFALAHPAMVSALVVADVGAGSDDPPAWQAIARAWAEAAEWGGMEAFADLLGANPLIAHYAGRDAAALRTIRACLMTHRARGVAHTAREVLAKRPPVYALETGLRRLRVPTLLVVGEDDAPCLGVHRFLAATIPGAESVVLPGVGHLTNLEAPAAFNAAVRRFLAR